MAASLSSDLKICGSRSEFKLWNHKKRTYLVFPKELVEKYGLNYDGIRVVQRAGETNGKLYLLLEIIRRRESSL